MGGQANGGYRLCQYEIHNATVRTSRQLGAGAATVPDRKWRREGARREKDQRDDVT